jgi:hypothetical protein
LKADSSCPGGTISLVGNKSFFHPRPTGSGTNKLKVLSTAARMSTGWQVDGVPCDHLWIKEWKVEKLVDALKLSRASGIAIEKFAGGMIEAENPMKQIAIFRN